MTASVFWWEQLWQELQSICCPPLSQQYLEIENLMSSWGGGWMKSPQSTNIDCCAVQVTISFHTTALEILVTADSVRQYTDNSHTYIQKNRHTFSSLLILFLSIFLTPLHNYILSLPLVSPSRSTPLFSTNTFSCLLSFIKMDSIHLADTSAIDRTGERDAVPEL